MKAALALLGTLFVLALPSPARAQSYEDADKRNAEGRAFYDAGQFEASLTCFKEAFALYPSDRYLFNAAKACVRLKDAEGAIYFYERYLTFNPVAKDRAHVENETSQLRKRLARKGLYEVRLVSNPSEARVAVEPARPSEVVAAPGSLFLPVGTWRIAFTLPGYLDKSITVEVTPEQKGPQVAEAVLEKGATPTELIVECNVAGARVFINGSQVGNTPLTLGEPEPGDVLVTVLQDGYKRLERMARVEPGKTTRVPCTLEPVATVDPVPTEDEPFPWQWVFLGTGAAGLVTAAVGGIYWYEGYAGMGDANDQRNDWGDALYRTRYSDARGDYVLGQWLTAAGGIVAAGGTVAWLLWPEPSRPAATFSMRPWEDGLQFVLTGIF